MCGDKFPNGRLELGDAAMDASSQSFVGQLGEPAFDKIEPRPVGRGEVDVEPRPLREPGPDQRRFVRPVVIHDQMHLEVSRSGRVDGIQELPEFGRAMPLMELRNQLTRFHVERGKQRARAMAPVVVRASLDLPWRIGNTGCVRSNA